MDKPFNIPLFQKMLSHALAAVIESKDHLSSLDGATGDGDHGTAICQALTAIEKSAQQATELKQGLNDMGFAAMMESCGSTSTLIGALFLGMSDGVEQEELNCEQVAHMFASGLANVQNQTQATVGDKTMMDALIPAVDALKNNTSGGLGLMFNEAAKAAVNGFKSTKDMVARHGRARNLGDRVIGHLDAGAASISIIFTSFSQCIAE